MSGSGCRDYRSSVGRRAVLGAGLGAGLGIGMGGLSVASGVYLLAIETWEERTTGKVMLVR